MSRIQKKTLHSRIRLSDGTVKNVTGGYVGLFDMWALSEVPEWSRLNLTAAPHVGKVDP